MKKIALLSLLASSLAFAGGYKIPETSLNALALGAANIAHNKSADAAYYNPANMVFMQDVNHAEFDLMYIGLEGTKFEGSVYGTPYNISAKEENFIVPSLHFVSSKLGDARVGLSVVVPAGLTKRWSDAPATHKAEEFSLQVVEFNPSIAIPITPNLGVAFGFRIIHSEGTVKASRNTGVYSQHLEGDSIDYGYNLALAYKPTSQANISITYRSKVNLTEEGSAKFTMLLYST
jgi:long-chain fatty acid transport protein